jgi:hypothetical protein
MAKKRARRSARVRGQRAPPVHDSWIRCTGTPSDFASRYWLSHRFEEIFQQHLAGLDGSKSFFAHAHVLSDNR